MKLRINWRVLLLFIAITEGGGLLSSLLSRDVGAKYAALHHPPLSPPGWLFGVIWPPLYAMMAVAAYLIYAKKGVCPAHGWFGAQLGVNLVWPIIFFRFGWLWAAAAVMLVLIVLIVYVLLRFGRISKASVWLMLPYLLWVLFAFYLNIGMAALNP